MHMLPSLIYIGANFALLAIDSKLGNQISLWVIMLLPIGLATWNLGRNGGFVTAIVSAAALLFQGLILGHPWENTFYFLVAMLFRILVILSEIWLVGMLREQRVMNVKTLRLR